MDINFVDIFYYIFKVGEFVGEKNVIIFNMGYIGVGGFELYFYLDVVMKIWDVVFEVGVEFGIKLIGFGVCDIFCFEMGFCLYGNDLDDIMFFIEVGLGWIIKFVDGKNFINCLMFEK